MKEERLGLEVADRPTTLDTDAGAEHDGEKPVILPLHSLKPSISTGQAYRASVAEAVVDPYAALGGTKLVRNDGVPGHFFDHQQLVRRASSSGNVPLIIGVTVGGLSFFGILIIAIVVWRRRLKAKERRSATSSSGLGGEGNISVAASPTTINNGVDKLADLGMVYKSPGSTYGTGASRSSSINNRTRSTPTSPIDKSQIRHHSWTQDENILGGPTPPAIAAAQMGGRFVPRVTTPLSTTSSPSSVGTKSKRRSSILQRFGSRDLSSSSSQRALSANRGPPPPRPPRPEEGLDGNEDSTQPQMFELSASPSVKRKRLSKPLPVLPTFLVREHEEEMKRRRDEWEKEKKENYEKLRRPQSPMDDSIRSTPPLAGGSSVFAQGSSEMNDRLAFPEGPGLRKVTSLDSLVSTTTNSSSSSSDQDETPGGTRRPSPEVNPLSPRSSQRRPVRGESELRPPIPSFANTEIESVATGSDSLMKRTSYLVADGSSGVEATAVAPGFPSPKLPLRLTPPLSSVSTHSSNHSSLFGGPIQAPVSATVPKPLMLPPPSSQQGDESPGARTRTESTSSGGVAASVEHRDGSGTFMIGDNPSDRALAFNSIEDWRESVGETYAATRPTTAGAASMSRPSAEDINASSVRSVVVDATPLVQPRPIFPRRISVDTGVGSMRPPPCLAAAGGTFLTPSTTSTASALSPFTPVEKVPVSAVTPPSDASRQREVLRPSTSEREKEVRKAAEGASKRPKRKSLLGNANDEGVESWLNVDGDSDSDDF